MSAVAAVGNRVVAIIPARGGSKQVPRKNVLPVGGTPLIARAVRAAAASSRIDRVIVSTDDREIAGIAAENGAVILRRPDALASDTATSEAALLHALNELDARNELPEVLVFIQATSPFIDPVALDEAVGRVLRGEADVVFSAIETFAFLWRHGVGTATGAGTATGVNHDHAVRPRRQDREPHYQETGAFYVMRVDGFRRAGHRFFGRVGIAVVDERTAIEIDSIEQFAIASAIAPIADASGQELTKRVLRVNTGGKS